LRHHRLLLTRLHALFVHILGLLLLLGILGRVLLLLVVADGSGGPGDYCRHGRGSQ
jgi:hypothetical protein